MNSDFYREKFYDEKMKRLYLACTLFFCTALGVMWLFGHSHKEQSLAISHPAEDLAWIRKLLIEYQELSWLTKNDVHVTPENEVHNPKNSYSFKLFGANFPEFDRTIMTLNCLNLFLDGKYEDYLQLVYLQPEADRLEWKSFLDIQRNIHSILQNMDQAKQKETRKVLEIALILGDVVKTKNVEKLASQKGILISDYDCSYRLILTSCPEIFPSYEKLSGYGKELLYKLSFQRCFGYIAHLESGAELFSLLKNGNLLTKDEEIFDLALFVYQCDVGGALGHVDAPSSIAYNEQSHLIANAVKEACLCLKHQDESAAFERYLSIRADWLGFDITSPLNRVLARIGAMLRLTKPDEGKMLKESFLKLPPDDLSLIVDAFNIPKGDIKTKISMYIPAVLVNLSNNMMLGSKKKERLSQTIHIGLPFIAKVLNSYKMSKSPVKTLNFDEVAKVAREEPTRLAKDHYSVDSFGHIILSSP